MNDDDPNQTTNAADGLPNTNTATGNPPPANTTGNTTTNPPPPNTVDINAMMGDMVNNPSLPAGTEVKAVPQIVNPNEIQTAPAQATANQATAAQAQAVQATAGQAGPAVLADTQTPQQQQAAAQANATYDATMVDPNAVNIQGVHGTVTDDQTVQGQMAKLMDFQAGTTPAWAAGAIRTANDAMAARGMGASSLAGAAVTQAVMEAGLPIAQADATIHNQMALANLTNDQQALITKTTLNQQAMLSNQAMDNAAKQFNAQNKTQIATFFAGLMSDVDKFNATQQNALSQFNAGQETQVNVANAQSATQVAVANAQNATAVSTSNAAALDAMNKFNIGNQLLIDQSNTVWRRDVNTANTTAENAANQANALNLLGISNTAMNNMWQASRDAASWANTSSENEKERAGNIAVAMVNKDTQFDLLNAQQSSDFWSAIGGFALDVLGSYVKPKGTT